MKSGAIETTVPETADPELGEPRCPNGHDSSLPPKCPALLFVTCHHHSTEATWNEFCITCGVRHEPFSTHWHFYRVDDKAVGPKNYCGYCGAKMDSGRASHRTFTATFVNTYFEYFSLLQPKGLVEQFLRTFVDTPAQRTKRTPSRAMSA